MTTSMSTFSWGPVGLEAQHQCGVGRGLLAPMELWEHLDRAEQWAGQPLVERDGQ